MAALSSFAMAAMAAGSVISAASALQQGEMAAKQASAQADLLRQQGERERELGLQQEEDYRRQQSRRMASRRAILGGSGVEGGSGSPLYTSMDMSGEIELQALRIRSGAETAKDAAFKQAALTEWGGQAAKRNSYLRAGGSLLSGIGQTYGTFYPRTPTQAPPTPPQGPK
jgi:hypothetical protein